MMNTQRSEWNGKGSAATLLAAALLLTGCGLGTRSNDAGPATLTGQLRGVAMGGRQPISGAAVTMYAAGTSGYASGATVAASTTTDPQGNFYFSSYSCTAGRQMYLTSLGGDPGAGTNSTAAIMGALGDCANLGQYSTVVINEVTTVAAAFALAPFSSGYSTVGSSPTNTAGLARAFASFNKLANVVNGSPSGSALPAGATAPVAEVISLANVLAACVNTGGGTAGDGSTCGKLFSDTTPASGTAPTNTIQAAINIAQNPALNVSSIYGLIPGVNPYSPGLTQAPNDWTMSINYTTGFSAPKSTTIDANGKVWVANSGSNNVTVLAQTGTPSATVDGNGLNAPAAVAIDSTGTAWVANNGGSTVSTFSNAGGTGTTYTVGAAPTALSFDAAGNVFVANSGSSSVTELNSSGAAVQTLSAGVSAPTSLAINPK